MSTENLIEVRGLTKEFCRRSGKRGGKVKTLAVNDVSFDVGKGESVGIVGESGSGKTTLARMLVGLEVPTAGTITIAGEVRESGARVGLAERRRRARQTQMVFQDPYRSLDPRQRVIACVEEALNLYFGGEIKDPSARALSILESVGLDRRMAMARPHALSGGQRQRVAIARALAADPATLILDEAVAALDVSVQAQVLNVIADIQTDRNISVITITHDLAVARQVADRLIVMKHGKIVEEGLTEAVLDRPESDYTKRLLASVPRPGWKPERRGKTAVL